MRISMLLAGLGASFAASGAYAQAALDDLEIIGKPVPDGIGFQPAVTELARDIHWLDNFVLVIITVITLFVVGLLAYAILRFNAKSNPTPASFTLTRRSRWHGRSFRW